MRVKYVFLAGFPHDQLRHVTRLTFLLQKEILTPLHADTNTCVNYKSINVISRSLIFVGLQLFTSST